MYRKSLFSLLFVAIAACSSGFVSAQTIPPITGTVELEKGGAKTPLAGAKVDLYREDVKGQGQTVTTGADGKFSFAGAQPGKPYLLSVSGPGASPTYLPGIKAGMQNVLITMESGDGRKVTEDELKNAMAAASGQMSEADKKKQAELEKKRQEIEANNKRIEESGKIIDAALKEGSAAFEAKNYDVAVAKYEEGYAASPDFVGSAPVLLNNKGTALYTRAVATYNANVKNTDAAAKQTAMSQVKKDLGDAAEAFNRSWTILKNAPATEITNKPDFESNKVKALSGAREAFRLMIVTEKVDETKAPIAKELIDQYVAIETDKAKKDAAILTLADIYRIAQDSENAIAEYRKILAIDSGNLDALAGAGLSLVNLGYINDDKAKLQEGADLLQRYASAAPDNHKYKNDALGLIDTLKKEQNIAPQKAPAKRKN